MKTFGVIKFTMYQLWYRPTFIHVDHPEHFLDIFLSDGLAMDGLESRPTRLLDLVHDHL